MPALTVKGRLELVVRDRDGRVVQRHRQTMHSFTMNFVKMIANLLTFISDAQSSSEPVPGSTACYISRHIMPHNITSPGGIDVPIEIIVPISMPAAYTTISLMSINALSTEDFYGILIGSGTKPFTPTDHNLEKPYNLQYFEHGETLVEGPVLSGDTVYVSISRQFRNITQDTLTVSETGLFGSYLWPEPKYAPQGTPVYDAGAPIEYKYLFYLIARDVLTKPVTVPSNGSVTVRYNIHFKL